jgi:hypothetical protein
MYTPIYIINKEFLDCLNVHDKPYLENATWDKFIFGINIASSLKSYILDEIREQHKHQSITIRTISNAQIAFF